MKRRISLESAVFCAISLSAGAFVVAVRARSNWDQDIWWHLRAGQWIAEHGQLPSTDPFSTYGQGKAWIVYTWLFDLIAYETHHWLGLRGVVLLSAVLGLAIAAALYILLRALHAPWTIAAPLTLVSFDAMMPLTTPRPWLFSMLFFLVELNIVVSVMRSRMEREALRLARPEPVEGRAHSGGPSAQLWLLPPLFIVWANVHVQFIIGLVVLAAAAVDALWNRQDAGTWILLTAVCAAAALVNPYHVGVYVAARQLMAQSELWTRIGELLAPDFRHSTDWIVLAMALTAAGGIGSQMGVWRTASSGAEAQSAKAAALRPPIFLLLLFVLGAYLGFKSRRDTWLTITASACAIASVQWDTLLKRRDAPPLPGWVATLATAAMAVLLPLASLPILSEETLSANVARTYPSRAAAFVEARERPGPLYNYFDWGGYLMWRLPQWPVQMDGRTIVHGEPRILAHVDTWQGKASWRADPELAAARIVIGPRDLPLTSLLRLDQRFTVAYEDREGPAVVFERK
jgi:hypothetical protein